MAVEASDVNALRYSTKSGSAGNSESGNAAGSLGKYMSTSDMSDASVGNLVDTFSESEAQGGTTIYRCVFIYNRNGSDTWSSVLLWIASQEANGASVSIGLDPAGVVDHDTAAAQAEEIADEETAPSGVTFSAPTSEGSALDIGDIGPEQCQAVWLRWVLPADAQAFGEDDPDDVVLRVKGTAGG